MGLVHWKLMDIFFFFWLYRKSNVSDAENVITKNIISVLTTIEGYTETHWSKCSSRGFVAMLWLSKLAFPPRKNTQNATVRESKHILGYKFHLFRESLPHGHYNNLSVVSLVCILPFVFSFFTKVLLWCFQLLWWYFISAQVIRIFRLFFMVLSNWFNNHFKHSRGIFRRSARITIASPYLYIILL